MGRLVNHLQQIHNFTDHCRDVLQNLMTQLNVLFGGKDKSPVKINPGIKDANESAQIIGLENTPISELVSRNLSHIRWLL